MDFNYYLPTNIVFGCGKIYDLIKVIDRDISNILIVTDKNVFEKSGVKSIVLKLLKDFNIEIFDEVEENPSLSTLTRGREISKDNNIQLIIGIGGGSPMDAAKGIAASTTNDGTLLKYIGGKDLTANPLPLICIPTTSGTGSEVTPFAVFTDSESETKVCLSSNKIFPQYSIIDPELTYSMHVNTIVNTGVDTLTHSIEAYLSINAFPLNDLFAVQSIKLVLENLHPASQKNKVAMNKMAYASMLAGIAITHASTILLHIMAYPLTIFHKIQHGKANGILLPAFIEFMKNNSTENAKEKIKIIENMFDKSGGVNNFVSGLGISTKLSSYGINETEFEMFANDTIIKDDVKITPAEITKEDIIEIYKSTF